VGSATRIIRHHNVRSDIIYLSNSLISRFFLIVSLGLPLPLVIHYPIWSTLLTEFSNLLSTCPNHLNQVYTVFSTKGPTTTLSLYLFLFNVVISSPNNCLDTYVKYNTNFQKRKKNKNQHSNNKITQGSTKTYANQIFKN